MGTAGYVALDALARFSRQFASLANKVLQLRGSPMNSFVRTVVSYIRMRLATEALRSEAFTRDEVCRYTNCAGSLQLEPFVLFD